jgi:hypothetical protein
MTELELARARIVEAARALLAGELSVLEAAQRIAGARHDLDPEQVDSDLLFFAGIDSEGDPLTILDSVHGWHPSVRAQKEREVAEFNAFYQAAARESTEALLAKFARTA